MVRPPARCRSSSATPCSNESSISRSRVARADEHSPPCARGASGRPLALSGVAPAGTMFRPALAIWSLARPAVVEHPLVAPLVAELLEQRRHERGGRLARMDRRLRELRLEALEDRRRILDGLVLRRHGERHQRQLGVALELGLRRRRPHDPRVRDALVAEDERSSPSGRQLDAEDAIDDMGGTPFARGEAFSARARRFKPGQASRARAPQRAMRRSPARAPAALAELQSRPGSARRQLAAQRVGRQFETPRRGRCGAAQEDRRAGGGQPGCRRGAPPAEGRRAATSISRCAPSQTAEVCTPTCTTREPPRRRRTSRARAPMGSWSRAGATLRADWAACRPRREQRRWRASGWHPPAGGPARSGAARPSRRRESSDGQRSRS